MTTLGVLMIQAALLALVLLLALAGAAGVAVALRPGLLDRLRAHGERRFSMRRATRSLDIPRSADAWLYRHHRAYGVVTITLSLFLLGYLTFGYMPRAEMLAQGTRYIGVAAIVIDTARIVLWLCAVTGFAVGLIVYVRPSALKDFERRANRWLTPRQHLRGLEREYHGIDRWVGRHPRIWGAAVAVASLLLLLALILHIYSVTRLGG